MRKAIIALIVLLVVGNLMDYDAYASAPSLDEPKLQDMEDEDFEEYFNEYFTYESMMDALNKLETDHSDIMRVDDLTSTINEAVDGVESKTWQGRYVWLVKISDNVENEPPFYNDRNEPDVLVIGAHHGNEWTGFQVAMHLIFYLTEYYCIEPFDNDEDGKLSEDPEDNTDNDGDGMIDEDENEARISWLVDNREIWIIPMLNPDGVVMDQRKNGREEIPGTIPGSTRPTSGVDINRNYPFKWNNQLDPFTGTGKAEDSANPFSAMYRGPPDNFDDDGDALVQREIRPGIIEKFYDKNYVDEDPMDNEDNDNDGRIDEDTDGGFSEPETICLGNLLEFLKNEDTGDSDIVLSISYHTYGGMILYPWGWTNEPTPHDALFSHIGDIYAGYTGYDLMQGPGLYPVSGELDDWLYGKHGVLGYTFELGEERKVPEEELLNFSNMILPCELDMMEMAPVSRIAKMQNRPDLDIGLPQINHTQEEHMVTNKESYDVEVTISNRELIDEDSIYLYYRAGEDGEFKNIQMRQSNKGEDVYYAKIPSQKSGIDVYYYVEANVNYLVDDRGILISSPKYGEYDPYSYFVDYTFGDTLADLGAMILMMLFMFGILLFGLIKSLRIALEADERKSTF